MIIFPSTFLVIFLPYTSKFSFCVSNGLAHQDSWVDCQNKHFLFPFSHLLLYICFLSSVQSLSHVWLFATPWTAACQASLSITNSRSLLKLMSIELVMPSHSTIHPSHSTISSAVVPFSSHFQSFPASGSLQMSQFFSSSGQSFGVSALASVLAINIQDWFPLGWTGWISLQSKTLKSLLQHHSSKASILCSAFFLAQLSHSYMTTEKTIALSRQTFVGRELSLAFICCLGWS